jgi:hypothetical protein
MLRTMDYAIPSVLLAQVAVAHQDFFAAMLQGGISIGVIFWFMKRSSKDSEDIKKGQYEMRCSINKLTVQMERANRVRLQELLGSPNIVIAKYAKEMLAELDSEKHN